MSDQISACQLTSAIYMPNMPTVASNDEEFFKVLTEHQSRLMGFIMASIGDYTNASDILQKTNIVLWQKAKELNSLSEFMPWAFTIAKYKILSHARDSSRERLIFSTSLIETMFDIASETALDIPLRQAGLRECISKLPEQKRQLLYQKYAKNKCLQHIANSTGSSIAAVKSKLLRLRRILQKCIDHHVSASANSSMK